MDKRTYIVWWDTDQSEAPTIWVVPQSRQGRRGIYQYLRDNVEEWALIAVLREDFGIGDEEDEE